MAPRIPAYGDRAIPSGRTKTSSRKTRAARLRCVRVKGANAEGGWDVLGGVEGWSVRRLQVAMLRAMREWRLLHETEWPLEQIAQMIKPIVRGWIQYYGRYYKSALDRVLDHLNWLLGQWARRKFKSLRQHQRKAMRWLGRVARRQPNLFAHWQFGVVPEAE